MTILATDPQSQPRVGNTRWAMIGLIFMVAAVAYLDRSNIAIAAPLLKEELGLSNVELGVVFSAFSLGYAATQPVAGRLADRFGAYRIIALGVVVWSVLTAVTASIPAGFGFAFLALLGVRFALGVSEAVIFPASNRMVANWMPPSERGLANGLIFAGVGVGAGIAPPLITTIMLTHDWRAAFWATAAIGLVALVLWLLMARETPAAHPWASAAERDYIKSVIPDSSSASTGTARWTMIIGNRTVQLLVLHLSLDRAWARFEIKRDLRHPAVHCDGGGVSSGRLDCRSAHGQPRRARGSLRCGECRHGAGCSVHCRCHTGGGCARGGWGAGAGIRCAISGAECFLDTQCGYRPAVCRRGIGRDEHGQPDRRGWGCDVDAPVS